jgi:hypothetical protein
LRPVGVVFSAIRRDEVGYSFGGLIAFETRWLLAQDETSICWGEASRRFGLSTSGPFGAKLQLENRVRDLAMFNLAIDRLRGCDVVALKVEEVAPHIRHRALGIGALFERGLDAI